MKSDRVRIAFVGVGAMGQSAHLKNYVLQTDCEVVAITEIRPKTAAAVAKRYGIPAVYDDCRKMMEKENPDAIVASQPFSRHGILVPDLISFGKPLFIEKPLAGSVAIAEKLAKLQQKSGVPVMLGYHKRSDPATEYAVERIREFKTSGKIGKLTYVRILMPAGDWISGGFSNLIDEKDAPGELEKDLPDPSMDEATYKKFKGFVNYYIHQVNLMRFLLGESWRVTYADPSGVMLAGTSESGAGCVIELSPYNTSVDWQESALVAFEHGWVKLQLPAPLASFRPGRVEVMTDPGKETPMTASPDLPWEHAMLRQSANFIRVVKGKAEPPCGAAEALEDIRLAADYIRLLHTAKQEG